jgi:MFS-type transporter involved in bile tolerance (Atg22 family)
MSDFQLSQVEIGLFFMIMPIFYIPTSLIVQKIPNGIQKRAIIITALIFSFIGNLFTGPSVIFGFKDSIWIMAIG